MAEPKSLENTPTLEDANNDIPNIACPMDEDEEPEFDHITGEMDLHSTWDGNYGTGITWCDWFTKYRAVIPEKREREWHLWCWMNQSTHDDAADYIFTFGKPEEGTTTRKKQRSAKAVAWEESNKQKKERASAEKAHPKK